LRIFNREFEMSTSLALKQTPDFVVPCKLKMSADEYHAHPAAGSTSLKNILRSPLHYKYEKENPSDTPALRFGRACHEALLEPNLFMQNAVVMPEFSGTGSRAAKEQWMLSNEGKTILKSDELDSIKGMLLAVSKHKTARALLSDGAAEESYFDQCPETGLVRKVRPDFLRQGHIIVDVKTTTNGEPRTFERAIATFNYHLSAAYYLDVVSSVTGERFDQFIIVAVEKEAPFGVSVHLLDDGTIGAGRHLYKKALNTLKECKSKNAWPGYPDEILSASLPHWAFPSEE
jgi:hypothetical protein